MIKRFGLVICSVLLGVASIAGCNGGQDAVTAQEGDTVQVHYTGSLEDGTVFGTSTGGEPLEFVLGDGSMIEGFDKTVNGMQIGEVKTVTIPTDEAYGQHRDDLVWTIEKSILPEGSEPSIGQELELYMSDGSSVIAVITAIADDTITVDANHVLAGEDLIFEIELMSIS